MDEHLFRKEVIEHQRQRLHGSVLALPKVSHSIIASFIACWTLIVIVWLCTSSYARKVTVLGWLEPPEGLIRIYPEASGLVKEILVKEGDEVDEGQILLVISGDVSLASGGRLEARLLEEFKEQKKLLEEQLIRLAQIRTVNQADLIQQFNSAKDELTILASQKTTLEKRYELIGNQKSRIAQLAKSGNASEVEVESIAVQVLEVESEKQQLERIQISQVNKIKQLEAQLDLLPSQTKNQSDQLHERISSIRLRVTQLSGELSHAIKAPRAGIINNLQAVVGQQAQANGQAPLLTLLPNNSSLNAQVLIPVHSAGFLAEGQSLNIRFDAFPYQKFGIYSGQVTLVSNTILLPNEILNAPISVSEPVYRITAELDQPYVRAYGKDLPLRPGMTLSADIKLGNRTLLQWLLEPIYSLKGRF